MTKCPGCSSANCYNSGFTIECAEPSCRFFTTEQWNAELVRVRDEYDMVAHTRNLTTDPKDHEEPRRTKVFGDLEPRDCDKIELGESTKRWNTLYEVKDAESLGIAAGTTDGPSSRYRTIRIRGTKGPMWYAAKIDSSHTFVWTGPYRRNEVEAEADVRRHKTRGIAHAADPVVTASSLASSTKKTNRLRETYSSSTPVPLSPEARDRIVARHRKEKKPKSSGPNPCCEIPLDPEKTRSLQDAYDNGADITAPGGYYDIHFKKGHGFFGIRRTPKAAILWEGPYRSSIDKAEEDIKAHKKRVLPAIFSPRVKTVEMRAAEVYQVDFGPGQLHVDTWGEVPGSHCFENKTGHIWHSAETKPDSSFKIRFTVGTDMTATVQTNPSAPGIKTVRLSLHYDLKAGDKLVLRHGPQHLFDDLVL